MRCWKSQGLDVRLTPGTSVSLRSLDRHEEFAEQGFRRPLVGDSTDELAAHQVREVGARQRRFHAGQDFGRQGLAALLLDLELGPRVHLRAHLGLAPFLLLDHALDQAQQVLELGFHVVPGAERHRVFLGFLQDQGVVAEQIAHALYFGLHVVLDLAQVDQEDVGILEDEELSLQSRNQGLEGGGGHPDVVLAPVEGAQPRKMNMERLASALVLLETAHVVHEQVFFAGLAFLLFRARRHQMIPLTFMAETILST